MTRDVGRSPEDRDPSSALDMYRSGDDDMDEPWDEPSHSPGGSRAPLKSPLLACVEEYFEPGQEEAPFDEGDLPTLSLNKNRSNTLLNGKQSTTRTMRPPSKLGLSEPPRPERREDTEQFWDQIDPPSTSSASEWDDDAPDDEMASLEMRDMIKKKKKKKEKSREDDEYYDDERDMTDNAEDQFCDVTAMLGGICGDAGNVAASPARQSVPIKRNLRPINDIPMEDDAVEEQTAIEVEYVEPEPTEKAGWSLEKKNSYLSSMARKAKDDFKKTVPEQALGEEKKTEAFEEDEATDKNVYSNFSATEKRKFLKMVNSGMTPTQSANKVVEEREAASTPGRRGLAFWKKPKPERSPSPGWSKKVTENDGSPVKVAVDSTQAVLLAEAESKDTVVTNDNRRAVVNEISSYDSYDSDDEKIESIAQDDSIPDNEKDDGHPEYRNAAAAAGAAAGVAAVAVTVATIATVNKDEKKSKPEVQDTFVKSGSNYYDAVRKNQDDEEQQVRESTLLQKANQLRAARVSGARAVVPKQQGFTALSEPEEKNITVKKQEEKDTTAKNAARRADKNSALSPTSLSARRFRLRGLRPGGFAALPEDDVGKSDTEAEEKTLNHSAAIGAAAVGTAAVAGASAGAAVTVNDNRDAAVRDLVGDTDQVLYEEDDASRLEQNLLRPMKTGGLTVKTAIPEDAEDTSFDIVTPYSMVGTPRGRAVEVVGDLSVDLDNYLDSATAYSSNHDQMSVVSGKSHWTAATGSTNYTTSSRVRRPGAAKGRLAKAKKADKSAATKKGWHESIKNAAANSNQQWDPKDGFAEYEDPGNDVRDVATDEVIHLDLKGVTKRSVIGQDITDDGYSQATPSNVDPLPQAWEAEREDILDEDGDEEDTVDKLFYDTDEEDSLQELPSETDDEEDTQHELRGKAYDSPAPRALHAIPPKTEPLPDDDNRPKGWVETMKAASAKFAKNGATWDPETGWQGLNNEVLSDSPKSKRTGTDPPASGTDRAPAPDPDGVPPAIVAGGVVAVAGATAAAVSATQSDNHGDHDVDNNSEVQPRSRLEETLEAAEHGDHDVDNNSKVQPRSRLQETLEAAEPQFTFVEPQLGERPGSPSQGSRSLEVSDASVISLVDTITTAQDEKYVQIGDTGSVRSFIYNQSPNEAAARKIQKQTSEDALEPTLETVTTGDFHGPLLGEEMITEDDTAPLLVSDAFVRATDRSGAEVVKVVKEKNTQDDIGLFAHDSRNNFLKVQKDVTPQPVQKQPSKRRGQGPVDIDEIDDMDFGEDDDDSEDEMWASKLIRTSATVAAIARAPAAKKANEGAPPKIKAPTKDTYPIHEYKIGDSDAQRTARKDSNGTRSAASSSVRALDMYQEPAREDPRGTKNSRRSSVRASDALKDDPAIDELAREDPRGTKNPRSSSVRAPDVLKDDPVIDDQSSKVKSMARQWESRASGSSPNVSRDEMDDVVLQAPANRHEQDVSWPTGDEPPEDSPAGTAEWKSFLEKKVMAESVTATKQERAQRNKPEPPKIHHGQKPAASFPIEKEGDDDSLFEFKPSMRDQAGAFPTTAHSRPDDVGDSFSEISPIQTHEEEYDEEEEKYEHVNRSMDAVSDTGTNIEQGSFLKRLQACAAPIIPRQFSQFSQAQVNDDADSVPFAHLAFLRSSPQANGGGAINSSPSARFVPPNLCGRPDTISEEAGDSLPSPQEVQRSSSAKRAKQRSSSRYSGSDNRSTVSDEGFGARTSYLDALAMEAAVSKPKRHGSKGRSSDSIERSRSSMSDVSTGSRRSEKWQEFLDRKSVGMSPDKQRTGSAISASEQSDHLSDLSKVAEKYAAQQVKEMMEAMTKKRNGDKRAQVEDMIGRSGGAMSPSTSGDALSPYSMKAVRSEGSKSTRSARSVTKKNESARAAEELAAARVEAMMQAMTSQNLDGREI